MYIKRIVIKNYRNLKDIDLSFGAGLTCIVGENNSGKSNFLHAIRLALDMNLPYYVRQLTEDDFAKEVDFSVPQQIVVGVQFTDFFSGADDDKVKEHALAQEWGLDGETAQVCYRFRPKGSVRRNIASGEREPKNLTIEDYDSELVAGPIVCEDGGTKDLSEVCWDDDFSTAVKFNRLSTYRVAFLQPIRDVEDDLRRQARSPLYKLIKVSDMSDEKKKELIKKIDDVNKEISSEAEIQQIAQDIDDSFSAAVGSIFKMNTKIGMMSPTFRDITRSLKILLSGQGLEEANISRNGLGLNNILYMSMLLEYYKKQGEQEDTAGELLLIEEPEAHLHPQLQRVLLGRLENKECQIITTSHSTHITSRVDLNEVIVFTRNTEYEISAKRLSDNNWSSDNDKDDLERYIDATKSVLLFAKKVILVEGMAEVFLIPFLVKKIKEIDLEEHGISIVPIHGVHFSSYLKLFGNEAIKKKCAVITDGDLRPSDSFNSEEGDFPRVDSLRDFENDFVRIFHCGTTFEIETASPSNLKMFASSANELGAPRVAKDLMESYKKKSELSAKEKLEMSKKVLNTAKRFGKARYAQISSRYSQYAEELPTYLDNAIDWLIDEAD